jgi:Ion channel
MNKPYSRWGVLDLRVTVGVVIALVIVVLMDNEIFTKSVHYLGAFLFYQALSWCLIGLVLVELFLQLIRGRQGSLDNLSSDDDILHKMLEKYRRARGKGRTLAVKTIRERVDFLLEGTRIKLFASLFLALALLSALLALNCMTATGYFGAQGKFPFDGLDNNASFVHYFYFVAGTMATLGNGEIKPTGTYGYILVVITIYIGFFFFSVGIGFVVGHWFSLVARCDKELEQLIAEIYARPGSHES